MVRTLLLSLKNLSKWWFEKLHFSFLIISYHYRSTIWSRSHVTVTVTSVGKRSDRWESCRMVPVGSHRLLFTGFDRFLSVGIRSVSDTCPGRTSTVVYGEIRRFTCDRITIVYLHVVYRDIRRYSGEKNGRSLF